MHTLAGKIVKYVLRVLFAFILTLLLVGLVKYRGDVNAYVRFLNTRDWNQARGELSISQPDSFAHMFRGTGGANTTGMIDILSGELLTGDEFTGIDAYDPNFEAELNNTTSTTTNETGGFGFTNAEATQTTGSESSKQQLLNLIKQRELKK